MARMGIIGTDLEPAAFGPALEKLANRSVTLADLAKLLAPNESGPVKPPAKIPLPAVIKPADEEALKRLPEIFGSAVPTERRILEDDELAALKVERDTLDVIVKLLETRKDGIRTSVLNHFDVIAEEEGFADETTPRDKDGHYLLANSVAIPDSDMKYAWEVSGGDPIISPHQLESLLDHDEWLAVTEPVRVFDEHKALVYLRKHPELMAKLAKATEPGKHRGAFNLRKQK